MAKNLIKTSHYMTPASRDEIQRLAQQHARSAGWVVRKCGVRARPRGAD